MPRSLLFNPFVRVWTLRFLLLWTSILIVQGFSSLQQQVPFAVLILTGLCIIAGHHIISVFHWPFKGSAFLDLVLTFVEILAVLACTIWNFVHSIPEITSGTVTADLKFGETLETLLGSIMFTLESLTLMFLGAFRLATIARCPKGFLRQRLGFLSECTPLRTPYTAAGILLSRTFARPLVRGESGPILFVRAGLLWCIGVGVPIFGLIAIIFAPTSPEVHSNYVSPFQFDKVKLGSPPGNASLLVTALDQFSSTGDPGRYNIQVHMLTTKLQEVDCNIISAPLLLPNGNALLIQCPYEWSSIVNVSLSLSIPPGSTGVNVVPMQGAFIGYNRRELPVATWLSELGDTLDVVPLFSGSALGAAFTWTQTNMTLNAGWSLFSPPTMAVYTADIRGLQALKPVSGSADPALATLTLVQRNPTATKQFIDTPDSTVLNGIATFGGFWTFLNGAFALFFGANVLYFAFGRRPLSALGLVHVFQRSKLQRQWNEDFPAIHTEGGLPGSESAGIVAFIRERLVDLGEDPHRGNDSEKEALETKNDEREALGSEEYV